MSSNQPNILMIMADQLAAPALGIYGNCVAKTPNIDALADRGTIFENAYCNYPQCAPSRFSMLTGCLPSYVGAYDNASEFQASIPTFLHYLRLSGYKTCLSGKMHFIGPDQLHGYEERLTPEIYPSDFTWCPDWTEDELSYHWSHRLKAISESGVCARTLQLDYDEEVAYHAEQKIYDFARGKDDRPFFLTASFTHPHNPYLITQEYWDRYDDDDIDMPAVAPITWEKCDPHSQRLYKQFGLNEARPSPEDVRNTRHAYYAMISYFDDKVGQLLRALEHSGQMQDTVVILIADHGDMMGERGLFYKMSFFEWSLRVPMVITRPDSNDARRSSKNVSLLDLFPTILKFADAPDQRFSTSVSGNSLIDLIAGKETDWPDRVYAEYLAEGTLEPCLMLRDGSYKLIYSESDPLQLYDLKNDPFELENRAGQGDFDELCEELLTEVFKVWDPPSLKNLVVESQKRRHFVQKALHKGIYNPWDYQPFVDASRKYIRSGDSVSEAEPRSRLFSNYSEETR